MNIISALALVLEGHRLRRKSCLTKEGGSGDYRLDEQMYLMETDQMRGIVSTSTHSVYGRKQDRTRAALLSSSDILADDWEIADPVYKIRETSIEDRTVHQRDVLFDALWRLSARTGLVDPDMPCGVTELLTAVESGIALFAQAPRDGGETQGGQTQAARDVLAERRRQVRAEGWTPEHDDEHRNGEMAEAAAVYLLALSQYAPGPASARDRERERIINEIWPWNPSWLKRNEPRRDLVKAGALILAEIERLDRATPPSGVETIRQDNTSGGL